MKYLALLVAVTACTDEPDLLDEIMQDVQPTRPDYDAKADGASFVQLMALHCPGIVEDGVPTYRGLTGTYKRFGLPHVNEPLRLTLVAQRDDIDATGTFSGVYTDTHGLAATYAGRFAALAENPAIGPVLSLDIGADGEWDRVYFVLGIHRSFGRVTRLCLAGAEHPFLLVRSIY